MSLLAIKTYAEQLEEVQAAISAIESGAQEYRIGNRTLRRADIQFLYEREKYLREMVESELNGSVALARWNG